MTLRRLLGRIIAAQPSLVLVEQRLINNQILHRYQSCDYLVGERYLRRGVAFDETSGKVAFLQLLIEFGLIYALQVEAGPTRRQLGRYEATRHRHPHLSAVALVVG